MAKRNRHTSYITVFAAIGSITYGKIGQASLRLHNRLTRAQRLRCEYHWPSHWTASILQLFRPCAERSWSVSDKYNPRRDEWLIFRWWGSGITVYRIHRECLWKTANDTDSLPCLHSWRRVNGRRGECGHVPCKPFHHGLGRRSDGLWSTTLSSRALST